MQSSFSYSDMDPMGCLYMGLSFGVSNWKPLYVRATKSAVWSQYKCAKINRDRASSPKKQTVEVNPFTFAKPGDRASRFSIGASKE